MFSVSFGVVWWPSLLKYIRSSYTVTIIRLFHQLTSCFGLNRNVTVHSTVVSGTKRGRSVPVFCVFTLSGVLLSNRHFYTKSVPKDGRLRKVEQPNKNTVLGEGGARYSTQSVSRRSLLSKCPTLSRYTCKYNSIYSHYWSTAFPLPIFTKLANIQCADRLCRISPKSANIWKVRI
jgi:hypothetical protein